MFTGIIEELGTVEKIKQAGHTLELTIQAENIVADMALGDSISINGVCLTVTNFTRTTFTMDIMPETFHSTSLKSLEKRSLVNLERAMHANGRFGGHFVTGHIDGTGQILKKTAEENAILIDVSVPEDMTKFLMMKGSIAVDGVSLTVFGNKEGKLTVSIIPHTAEETVLGTKIVGDIVNLEADMLAKHVYHFLHQQEITPQSGISEEFLKENGFS